MCRAEIGNFAGVSIGELAGVRLEENRLCRGEVGDVVQWIWGRACFAVWRWKKITGMEVGEVCMGEVAALNREWWGRVE